MSRLFCNRAASRWAILIAVVIAMSSHSSRSDAAEISVSVRGSGQPVLMIPGLNSAASVWDDTCTQLITSGVQCHLVQLPGFAGAQASTQLDPGFLPSMRDQVLNYLHTQKLTHPVIMGHSLGGFLALQVALKEPTSVERLVLVDALPFFAAATNPAATAETMRPMAQGMRQGMLALPLEQYQAQAKARLVGMTRLPDKLTVLGQWSDSSDRNTTAQAMVEMLTTDLRSELGRIVQPTLVLGSWAAYEPYGSTLEGTRKVFAEQYAKLPGVRIDISQTGYHFLMWDDPKWLVAQVKSFLLNAPR